MIKIRELVILSILSFSISCGNPPYLTNLNSKLNTTNSSSPTSLPLDINDCFTKAEQQQPQYEIDRMKARCVLFSMTRHKVTFDTCFAKAKLISTPRLADIAKAACITYGLKTFQMPKDNCAQYAKQIKNIDLLKRMQGICKNPFLIHIKLKK